MSSTAMTSALTPHVVPLPVRVLRRLKPVILAVLRSPLHGLLSADVLALTWRGRKTGRSYTLPLSYVEWGGRLYLCTRPEGSDWWKNVRDAGHVDLVLRGEEVRAVATLLDPATPEALDGLRAFVTRNPRTGMTLYRVGRGPNEQDLRREVLASVVIRLDVLP